MAGEATAGVNGGGAASGWHPGAGAGAAGGDSDVVSANLLLRLDDPCLEQEFWREGLNIWHDRFTAAASIALQARAPRDPGRAGARAACGGVRQVAGGGSRRAEHESAPAARVAARPKGALGRVAAPCFGPCAYLTIDSSQFLADPLKQPARAAAPLARQVYFLRMSTSTIGGWHAGGRAAPAATAGAAAAAPAPRGGGTTAGFRAPHAMLLAVMVLHAAAMLLARSKWARHRPAAMLGLRSARIAVQFWQTHVSPHTMLVWRSRLLAPGTRAAHMLAVSLLGVPLVYMHHSLLHPVAARHQPLMCALLLVIYVSGWLPIKASVWRDARAAPAVAAACGRLSDALLAVDSAAVTAFGGPISSASAAAAAPGASERCVCLMQTASLTSVIAGGVVLPSYITWSRVRPQRRPRECVRLRHVFDSAACVCQRRSLGGVELHAKRRYLQARGRRLRVRAAALDHLTAWARARGLRAAWPWPAAAPLAAAAAAAAAPVLLVAAPLLLWQLSGLIVLVRTPGCRAP
ncbi:MAG: hypothetical protein J3K34DRAFT_462041 [Monoraphidium minutum]|nr:MAG: hypothetical protein J3K34DRAFT_462041 [Monoraphidium minutum]